MSPTKLQRAALLVATWCAWQPSAHASEPDPVHSARILRGHLFPRTAYDASAFVTTQLGFRQGVLYQTNGQLTVLGLRKSLATAAVVESLDLDVRVLDWLALSAVGDLTAVVAASEVAAYGLPSQFGGSGRFGPLVRLLRIEPTGTQLAFRPSYQVTAGAAVDVSHLFPVLRDRAIEEAAAPPTSPGQALQRAQELENDLLRSAVAPIRRTSYGGSVHLAQTLVPALGLQLSYGLRREHFAITPFNANLGQLPAVGFDSHVHRFTGTLSFDAHRWHVPIAVTYDVSVSGGVSRSERGNVSSAIGPIVLTGPALYYSKRSLQIGLHVAIEKGAGRLTTPFGTGAAPTAYFGQFSMRAFWGD